MIWRGLTPPFQSVPSVPSTVPITNLLAVPADSNLKAADICAAACHIRPQLPPLGSMLDDASAQKRLAWVYWVVAEIGGGSWSGGWWLFARAAPSLDLQDSCLLWTLDSGVMLRALLVPNSALFSVPFDDRAATPFFPFCPTFLHAPFSGEIVPLELTVKTAACAVRPAAFRPAPSVPFVNVASFCASTLWRPSLR